MSGGGIDGVLEEAARDLRGTIRRVGEHALGMPWDDPDRDRAQHVIAALQDAGNTVAAYLGGDR